MILRLKNDFDLVAMDNMNVLAIGHLINGQAALHTTTFNGNLERLAEDFQKEQVRAKNGNRPQLLNGIIARHNYRPIAYLMSYPAFDQDGRQGLYGEDIYVDDNFRQHGVGHDLLSLLSEEIINQRGCFLEWVTDQRNAHFLKYIKKRLNGQQANKFNLDASILTKSLPFKNGVNSIYKTKPISKGDGEKLRTFVNTQLADHSSDYPIVGFITTNQETGTVASVTVVNLRYSTFQTQWGMVIEPTIFSQNVADGEKLLIYKSIAHSVRDFCKTNSKDFAIGTINWYVTANDIVSRRALMGDFDFRFDRIAIDDNSSKMIPFFLNKDALSELAYSSNKVSQAMQPKPKRASRSMERHVA